jgi:hypothetical protein
VGEGLLAAVGRNHLFPMARIPFELVIGSPHLISRRSTLKAKIDGRFDRLLPLKSKSMMVDDAGGPPASPVG